MAVNKFKISVKNDLLLRNNYKNEEDCATKWKLKYSWLPAEYAKLKEELDKISEIKVEEDTSPQVKKDDRVIGGVPLVTSGFIGWLSTRKEFQLQCYGPDIIPVTKVPKENF